MKRYFCAFALEERRNRNRNGKDDSFMSGRELLLDTFQGRPTERVPVAPFIFNNVIREKNNGVTEDPIAACAD